MPDLVEQAIFSIFHARRWGPVCRAASPDDCRPQISVLLPRP
jgi:hypothetical protein